MIHFRCTIYAVLIHISLREDYIKILSFSFKKPSNFERNNNNYIHIYILYIRQKLILINIIKLVFHQLC